MATLPRSVSLRVSGVSRTRSTKLRPLSGSDLSCSVSIVVEACVLVTSTIGARLVTVIVLANEAGPIEKLIVGADPSFRSTLGRLTVLKPDSDAVIVYLPVGRLINR